MEWRFILGLGGITLVVIALVAYGGMVISRKVQANAPESDFAMRVTPAGTALYACLVAFWLYCVGTLKFRPEGGFGTFLSSIDGKVTVVVLSLVFVFIVGALLEKLGYPIAKKEER